MNRDPERLARLRSGLLERRNRKLVDHAAAHGLLDPKDIEGLLAALGPREDAADALVRLGKITEDQSRRLLLALEADAMPPGKAFADRYRLEQRIGEGAVAVVYRALDEALGRRVALKVLKGHVLRSPAARQRFEREARVLARLSHPHIVKVHDAGVDRDDPYLALEWIDGTSLAEALKGPTLTLQRRVEILASVAEGVDHAHRNGVVHRDLKPANILIDARDGCPKVADFGMAHVNESDTIVTRTGVTMGTPLYMAPEQIRARRGAAAPPMDVFALGAILHELLAGEPAFSAPTVPEVYERVLRFEPPAPSRKTSAVPVALDRIVQKALEKNPSWRYASAGALARDLRRWLEGESVKVDDVGSARRFGDWLLRRWLPVAGGLMTLIALITVSILLDGRRVAARRVEELMSGARQAEQRGDWQSARNGFAAVLALDPSAHSAREGLARADVELSARAARERARELFNQAKGLGAMGDWAAAQDAYLKSVRADPSFREARASLALARLMMGDVAAAMAELDLLLQDHPDYAHAFIIRAQGRQMESPPDLEGAETDLTDALRTASDPHVALMARVARGDVRNQRGRWAEALADYREALRSAPPDWPGRAGADAAIRDLAGRLTTR